MKRIVCFLFISLLVFYSCINSSQRAKTPEELRNELKQKEQQNPLNYLEDINIVLTPQYKLVKKETLFRSAEYASDGVVLQGQIKNSATLAKFKDLRFKVKFYSKTETIIDEESYVLYEFFEPNSVRNISVKAETPISYEGFSFVIIGATPVYD